MGLHNYAGSHPFKPLEACLQALKEKNGTVCFSSASIKPENETYHQFTN